MEKTVVAVPLLQCSRLIRSVKNHVLAKSHAVIFWRETAGARSANMHMTFAQSLAGFGKKWSVLRVTLAPSFMDIQVRQSDPPRTAVAVAVAAAAIVVAVG